MGAALLAGILAKLVVGLLQWGAQRADFRRAIEEEAKNETAQRALVALGWKADHPVPAVDPRDSLAQFGVRDRRRKTVLPPDDHPAADARIDG